MDPQERDQLLKSGSCFRCKKQGHLARDCPQKQQIREATARSTNETPKTTEAPKEKPKGKKKEDPPLYESLLKQISACSMKERQQLMETLTQAEESDEEDF